MAFPALERIYKKRYISLSTIVFRLFQFFVLLVIAGILAAVRHSLLEARLLPESTKESQVIFQQ